ncbi:MAG: hypothetical protein ABJO67_09145 [Pseudoruegeria sp.]
MAASIFDSAIYRDLLWDSDMAALFTDSAQVRAMMLVEGVLAKAQAEAGIIPVDSGFFIHRAGMECQVDPAGLAAETAQTGDMVPALVAALQKALEAPEHAKFLHYGVSSDDIHDTAYILRLRQAIKKIEARLATDKRHADTLTVLQDIKLDLLQIRLSGEDGTLDAMKEQGPNVRAAVAQGLALADPGALPSDLIDTLSKLGRFTARLSAQLTAVDPAVATVAAAQDTSFQAAEKLPVTQAKRAMWMLLPAQFMALATLLEKTSQNNTSLSLVENE